MKGVSERYRCTASEEAVEWLVVSRMLSARLNLSNVCRCIISTAFSRRCAWFAERPMHHSSRQFADVDDSLDKARLIVPSAHRMRKPRSRSLAGSQTRHGATATVGSSSNNNNEVNEDDDDDNDGMSPLDVLWVKNWSQKTRTRLWEKCD